MKSRFTTVDLFAVLHDLKPLIGLRINNIYDIDSKTYLLRFTKPDAKFVLLIESGTRMHLTDYDWPKNPYPSGFSMKLRKHIKQKRLISVTQLGIDRIVDFQFGEEEFACHVIVELYDRGNIVLTDHQLNILNILRPRTDKDTDVRFAVRQQYPIDQARHHLPLTKQFLIDVLNEGKSGENMRKLITPKFHYGPALLEHCLREKGLNLNSQLGKQVTEKDYDQLFEALTHAEEIFLLARDKPQKGYLVVKSEQKRGVDEQPGEILETYQEFHPFQFVQFTSEEKIAQGYFVREFTAFTKAVDEFFSNKESQKLDLKALQQEKEALKKLENFKKDHRNRLEALQTFQEYQSVAEQKAAYIELNTELVTRAITVIRSALANKLSWQAIQDLVDEAQDRGDPAASAIRQLKLDINHIVMELRDPFADLDSGEESDDENRKMDEPLLVEIDLALEPYQNARKHYDTKKAAAAKERKTLDAAKKALKSAEQKTQEALKQVQTKTAVNKQRKTLWFEKFLWFISSEDYLVIGGRDAQQNELLVKRYLRAGDVYVHADLRGASSVIVKNHPLQSLDAQLTEIPPKTLNEAGSMAVCCSAAWEAKVVAGAWWVKHDQVSKTAPSGEYLTPGSFMIRGKKNFLPPVQLQMGFGFLFHLDDESVARHRGERRKTNPLSHQDSTIDDHTDATQEDDEAELDIASAGDSEEEKSDNEFPDVKVELQHLQSHDRSGSLEEEVTVVQVGPIRPTKQQLQQSRMQHEHSARTNVADKDLDENTADKGTQPKRGQRRRKQKMQQKYKDQDEEERTARMEILGSSGQPKEDKKTARKKKKAGIKPAPKPRQPAPSQQIPAVPVEQKETQEGTPTLHTSLEVSAEIDTKEDVVDNAQQTEAVENRRVVEETPLEEDDEEQGSELQNEITEALGRLTATPFQDDLLTFAVPVCAPYTVMSSYKFKVKLTPGTGKKGKATKTAVQMFLRDKATSVRERDLLRASLDQDLGRNIPGKVKMSAPHLMASIKHHKKK